MKRNKKKKSSDITDDGGMMIMQLFRRESQLRDYHVMRR